METGLCQALIDLGTLLIWIAGLAFMVRWKLAALRLLSFAILSIAGGVLLPQLSETVPLYVWVILALLVSLALVRLVLMVFVGRRTADIATGSFIGIVASGAAYLAVMSLKGVRYLFSPRVFDYLRSPWQAPEARSRERH